MAMQFFNSLRSMKVKEVPAYVKPMLTRDKIKKTANDYLEEYRRKYIETSSIKPLQHFLISVCVMSYFVNHLPHARRHALEEEEAARHGGKGHGHGH